ncbi:hypothetical protein SAMN04244575_06301 [Sinorhizobium meliloti]|nr:hypothetical protein SAMN04244575_06301 [Sinorhizobium meliloti]
MISMAYDLAKFSMTALIWPAFDAAIALTRLDERIARSQVGLDRTIPFCRGLRLAVDRWRTRPSRGPRPPRRYPGYSHTHPRADHRPRRAAHPPAHFWPTPRLGVIGRWHSCTAKNIRDHIGRHGRGADGSFHPALARARSGREGGRRQKICLASTMPPSMRCLPVRRRRLRTQHSQAALAPESKVR